MRNKTPKIELPVFSVHLRFMSGHLSETNAGERLIFLSEVRMEAVTVSRHHLQLSPLMAFK